MDAMTRIFLATTGDGISRAEGSENGHWSVEYLLGGQTVECLAADPLDANSVYAGTKGNGVLRSHDRGKTWQRAGLDGQIVKAVAVSRAEPGTIYAGSKPALVFVSRDRGTTWRELATFRKIFSRRFWFSPAESPFTAYVQAFGLSPSDPNVIIAGIEAGAVVRSACGGKTWSDHCRGALRDCHSLTFHAANPDWVYEAGGSGAGVSFSRNAGASWTQPRAGLDRHYGWACAADPSRPEVWYASVSPGPFQAHSDSNAQAYIFRATGGAAWEKLGGGLPQPLAHMPYALLTDPAAPGHIYAGLSNGDLWHSANHGDAWEKLPLSLGSINRTLIMLGDLSLRGA